MTATLAMLLTSSSAQAQEATKAEASPESETSPEVEAASRLYEEGTAAHAAGRYAEAAHHFAEADLLLPDDAALEAALVSVLESDDAVLGMTLASRAARAPRHPALKRLAGRARQRFEERVGRVVVSCGDCEPKLDGRPIARGVAHYAAVGPHEVTLDADERRQVEVEPRGLVTLVPLARPAPPAPPPAPAPAAVDPDPRLEETGLHPGWFGLFAGLTAVGAGFTVWSAVDTASLHADFEASPTADLSEQGQNAQTRTNVLIGVTAGVAVATTFIGAFAIDWRSEEQNTAIRFGPGGMWLETRF